MNTKNEITKKPFTKPTIKKMNVLGGLLREENESFMSESDKGSLS